MRRKITLGAILLALVGILGWKPYIEYCKRYPNDLACPQPEPTPTPTPVPTPTATPIPPTPAPTQEPPPSSCAPADADPKWHGGPDRATKLFPEYANVVTAVGDRCGMADGTEKPQYDTLKIIAAKWRELYGRCAAQWADAVIVKADDGFWEEWHSVAFGNGCIATGMGAFKGVWVYPDSDECSAPKPDKSSWVFKSHPYGGDKVDCTPTVQSQCDFCKAIGMGEFGGVIRCGCPVRPDGHSERLACEFYLLDGQPVLDSRNGAGCKQVEGNVFQFYMNGGNCRLCDPTKTHCTDWY